MNRKLTPYQQYLLYGVHPDEMDDEQSLEGFYNAKPQPQSTQQPTEQPEQQEIPYYDTSEESMPGSFLRDSVRRASRAGETILGAPGDLYEFTKSVTDALDTGREPTFTNKIIDYFGSKLPTQASLQEKSQSLTGGYTAPQTEEERITDDITKTLTGLYNVRNPTQLGRNTTRTPFANAMWDFGSKLGQSVIPEITKETAKFFGASDETAEKVKAGTLFFTSLFGPRITGNVSPRNYINSLYQNRSNLVRNQTMPSASLLQSLDDLARRFQGSSTSRTGFQTFVRNTRRRIGNRTDIPYEEAFDIMADLERSRDGIMSTMTDSANIRDSRRIWGEANRAIDGVVGNNLQRTNPQAYAIHNQANRANATLYQSQRASRAIMRNLKSFSPKNAAFLTSLIGGLKGGSVGAMAGLTTTVAGASAVPVIQFMYRLSDPTLRTYYANFFANAIKQSASGMRTYDKKIEKRLDEIEEDEED